MSGEFQPLPSNGIELCFECKRVGTNLLPDGTFYMFFKPDSSWELINIIKINSLILAFWDMSFDSGVGCFELMKLTLI